jgi:hypothetical protein
MLAKAFRPVKPSFKVGPDHSASSLVSLGGGLLPARLVWAVENCEPCWLRPCQVSLSNPYFGLGHAFLQIGMGHPGRVEVDARVAVRIDEDHTSLSIRLRL